MRGKTVGLTIHYTLSAREDISGSVVRELVRRTAQFARKIGCVEVGGLLRAERNPDFAALFFRVGKPKDQCYAAAAPECGWLARVWPGAGCETATFGLCRYPRQIVFCGGSVPTGFTGGWQFRGFCKTQYAGKHGWENLLRCHRSVISLLDFWRGLGVRVRVNDEGGYWKTRSVAQLRDEVRRYDGLVAAMSGMFKDASADHGGGLSVQSPVFDYENFERLEHEGWQEFGGRLERLREDVREAK